MHRANARFLLATLILLMLPAGVAFPQVAPPGRMAELERRLATAPEAERAGILNEMAYYEVRLDAKRARQLAEQALVLAVQHDDRRGQAAAHKNLAKALMVLERHDEALDEAELARSGFAALGDRKEEASSIALSGIMLNQQGKKWLAIARAEQAQAIYREIGDDEGVAICANNLGAYHYQLGDYQAALKCTLEALAVDESLANESRVADDLLWIGNTYTAIGDYDRGVENLERALAIFDSHGAIDRVGTGDALNFVGVAYEKQGKLDQALQHFRRAREVAREVSSLDLEAHSEQNIGSVLKERGQYDQALTRFQRAAELKLEIGNQVDIADNYRSIAEVHLLQGRYREALEYLDKARRIGEAARSNEILAGTHRLAADVYRAMGRFEDAYDEHVRYAETREAMLDSERTRTMTELQERYDAQDRQRQIDLLAKDNALLKKDAKIRALELGRVRLTAGLVVALAVLAVGGSLLLFRRYMYLLAFWKKRSFIGHYRLFEEISSGGMGVVYRASSLTAPGTTVALKVIREELAGDERQRQRFINEGKIIDALDHPGIVKVLDRGEQAGRLYIAMELLEGRSLASLIEEAAGRGEPLALGRCLALLDQLVDALAAIHARGVVHRDISPSNVIVVATDDGEHAKLLDFGLAKVDTMTTLTEAGEILGTIGYLAPERLQNREVTAETDTFSLGALAYELVTLARPFPGGEPAEVLRQVLSHDPVRPGLLRPGLDERLEALILTMLARDPVARPDDETLRHQVARLRTELA